MIQDFCIINRFDVVSTVCDGCIGCTQFNICDTAGDAAKRSGKVCIAPYITIGIFVSLCSRSKREGKFIYYELNTSVLEDVMLWITDLKGVSDYEGND